MNSLHLLIWNDKKDIAKQWKDFAKRDGFGHIDILSTPDETDIVAEYCRLRPDVVILDLVDDDSDKPVGLSIGKNLREADPLAPIIVLTRKPESAYITDGYLRWQGFAGVYPVGVVERRNQFKDIVIAESLLVKHMLQPEYCLARACGLWMETRWQRGNPIIAALRHTICGLPSCGSPDAWHPFLSDAIHKALRAREWNDVARRYDEARALFQQSDPFYMAGSTSRRHLSHNVQVCLLGLAILLADGPVHEAIEAEGLDLADAVLIWCCIGTVHDAAYLSENLGRISARLAALAEKFAPFVGGKPLSPWTWPTEHHAAVAAKMWDAAGLHGDERRACTMIGEAISKHDAKARKGPPVSCARWHEFLAILCDELQDWQRERPGASPGIGNGPGDHRSDAPWRLIEPMRIGTSRDGAGHHALTLEFMVVDHVELIQGDSGSASTRSVGKRFEDILQTLQENLVCPQKLTIELAAHFLTRRVQPFSIRRDLPLV
jgi:hypothetical protein